MPARRKPDLQGMVESVVFKGVHYEMTGAAQRRHCMAGALHLARGRAEPSVGSARSAPFDIHIMRKSTRRTRSADADPESTEGRRKTEAFAVKPAFRGLRADLYHRRRRSCIILLYSFHRYQAAPWTLDNYRAVFRLRTTRCTFKVLWRSIKAGRDLHCRSAWCWAIPWPTSCRRCRPRLRGHHGSFCSCCPCG